MTPCTKLNIMYTLIVFYDHWTDDKYIRLQKSDDLAGLLNTLRTFQRTASQGVTFEVIDEMGQPINPPMKRESILEKAKELNIRILNPGKKGPEDEFDELVTEDEEELLRGEEEIDLEAMTKKELTTHAKEMGIKVPSKARKADIIELIENLEEDE